MVQLTDDEAAQLALTIRELLLKLPAVAIVEAIDESRRLGIEEDIESAFALVPPMPDVARQELKNLGTTRRRAPSGRELLRITLDRLQQRCIVLPAIAQALQQRLNTDRVTWKVDTEFVSAERIPETSLEELTPQGIHEIREVFAKIEALIPELVPGSEKGRSLG